MRTIPAAITAEASSNLRKPEAEVILRDTRLRFETLTSCVNTVVGSPSDVGGFPVCVHDADNYNGGILQAAIHTNNYVYARTATSGSAPTGAWLPGPLSNGYHVPGVIGGTIYYVDSNGRPRRSTGGTSFTPDGTFAPTQAFSGPTCLAPADAGHLFAAETSGSALAFHHIDTSTGVRTTCRRHVYGNTTYPLAEPEYSSVQFFDAFTLDSTTYWIVYCHGKAGLTWAMSWRGGVWGDPVPVVPQDYTRFVPYRVTVLNVPTSGSTAFLTGRLTRENMDGFSPAMDVYTYSPNGSSWTAMPRQSFLGQAEVRGKLLLTGSQLIYLGADFYRAAPATYFVGYDNAALKETVTDAVHGFQVSFPATKTAPSIEVTLANGDGHFSISGSTGLAKPGVEMWINAGYSGSTAQLMHARVQSINAATADGQRGLSLSAVDYSFGEMRDWATPYYVDKRSQTKHYDSCLQKDQLTDQGEGMWSVASRNMLTINPGFEVGTWTGWTSWNPEGVGGAGELVGNRSANDWSSLTAAKLTRNAGALAARFGWEYIGNTLTAKAGKSYTLSFAACTSMGPEAQFIAMVSGDFGEKNVYAEAVAARTGSSAWDGSEVTFTNQGPADCTLTLRFYLTNSTASCEARLDGVSLISLNAECLSFSKWDNEGILFSTNPYETSDFDLRGLFQDNASSSPTLHNRIGFGLLGLAVDKDNYVVLKVFRYSGVAGNIVLCKKRGGLYTTLATATDATITVNTDYWVRLVHHGGHFSAYVGTTQNWGTPALTYQWGQSDPPCPNASGKGYVGAWALVSPYTFRIFGMSDDQTCLALRSSNDGDWADFPSTGLVKVDDEIMEVTSKSPGTALIATDRCGYLTTFPQPDMVCLDLTDDGLSDDLANYMLVLALSSQTQHHTWRIASSHLGYDDFRAGGVFGYYCHATLYKSGNGIWNGREWPEQWLERAQSSVEFPTDDSSVVQAYIAPGLNVNRGVDGGHILRHGDRSACWLYLDDWVQLKGFYAYDSQPDNTTESLLRDVLVMSGTLGAQFNSTSGSAALALSTTPAWLADLRDFDLEFDASGPVTVYYHCSDQSRTVARQLNLSATAATCTSGSATYLYPATGTYHARVTVSAEHLTVRVNGACVLNTYDASLLTQTINWIGLAGSGTVTNVRIPELFELRDAVYFDNDSNAASGLEQTIIADRYIVYASRSGDGLLFSAFDSKTDLGPYTYTLFNDQLAPDNSGLVTFLRAYAEEIMEQVDETLAHEYGFIFKAIQLTKCNKAQAAVMINRLFRQVRENRQQRSLGLAADMRVENEDRFQISGLDGVLDLVVNAVTYTYGPAQFEMTIATRQYEA